MDDGEGAGALTEDRETKDGAGPTSRGLAVVAAEAASSKQGRDTVVLGVGEVLAIVDWFVITSGANERQVRAIAEEVEVRVKAAGGSGPLRAEGRDDAHWLLLDYGDMVVHVFLEETRAYYELERLWADVTRLPWEGADLADVHVAD